VKQLFAQLPGEFVHTDRAPSELIKLVCNAFHALKVSFANEIGRLPKSVELDCAQRDGNRLQDTSLNISAAYLRPGFAYGGSCLADRTCGRS